MKTLDIVDRCWLAVVIITVIAVASFSPVVKTISGNKANVEILQNSGYNYAELSLKKFSSLEELENYLGQNTNDNRGGWSGWLAPTMINVTFAADSSQDYPRYTIPGDGSGDTPIDFSKTNIQVEGVDEADIVKCDGKYLYVVSTGRVFIIDAYPAEDARILSEIDVGGVSEIYVNGDKLVVLGFSYVKVYDISDRENPVLKRDVSFNSSYFKSRMIGNYVYIILNSPVWSEVILPCISLNGENYVTSATEIYYFENLVDCSYNFITLMVVNALDDVENITSGTILAGTAQDLYVSPNSIYITYTSGYRWWSWTDGTEKTTIYKLSISNGTIEYAGKAEVPGRVLNQFSMDEYQGYFRIATTTGEVWGWGDSSARNNVYVLDENLGIIGRLEGIAPGEEIYSARFMGSRAYLVTFKKVDPLFVIDLADPTNPIVLGELELPGYSDYLHPYDENHIIGIGKDTIDAGSFAWRQGVKISLFDVSDPANPIEISRYVIGDRGTEWGDSYALSDHRAFLFSRERNLLVVPIELAERESSDVSPWTYGVRVWQGAYVFNISLEEGLVLNGRISHSENSQSLWSSYGSRARRSIYIENVLYTISDGMIKMNDLADLHAINSVKLPSSVQSWPIYYTSPGLILS
jgi:uncharacterized secreted protein with C-terminal beta-propeller domain